MAKNNKNNKPAESTAAEKLNTAEEAKAEAAVSAAENTSEVAENAAEKPAKAKKTRKNPFASKRFRHGTLSVVFTIIAVVAVVLVNVIFNLVADRFNISVDLTTDNIYSVEESTLERLAKIDSKVTLTITNPEDTFTGFGSYFIQTNEIAKKIAASNPNITLQYIDLLSNPNFTAQFSESLSDGTLIVQSEATERYRIIPATDYLLYYSDGSQIDSSMASMYAQYGKTIEIRSAAEESLLSAIVGVTNVNPKTVAFATGYGEGECAGLISLLEKNAYLTESVNLDLVSEISADIDFLVLSAPTADYSADALTKIDKWLDNGGKYGKNLIYCASAGLQSDTTNIDEFLAEWGIDVGDGVLYQQDANYGFASYGYSYGQLLQLADTAYSTGMTSGARGYFGNYIRPVKTLWDEYSNFANTPLITTYGDSAIVVPFDASEDWTPENAKEKGNFNAAVEASKVQFEGGTTAVYSKLIVLGSELMLGDEYISMGNYSNGEFALSLFNANNDRETISIAPKTFTMTTFEVVPATMNPIAVVFAIVLPIIIIVVGIVVYVRRRRK